MTQVDLVSEKIFSFLTLSQGSHGFIGKPWFYMYLEYKSSENTVRKEEIACNKQFLLFLQYFSKLLENFLPF